MCVVGDKMERRIKWTFADELKREVNKIENLNFFNQS